MTVIQERDRHHLGVGCLGTSFFDHALRGMQRALGADKITSDMRAHLVREQVRSAALMAPVTAIASMAVAFILVGITRDTPSFLPILAWAVALVSAQLFTLYRVATHRHRAGRQPGNPGRRALLNSLGMGLIWGALPAIGLPSHDHFMELTIAVVLCGVLFAAGFSLLILPEAALSFCAPVVLGSFIAILRMENSSEAMMLAAMLTIYSVVMVAISARYSRNTVEHLVQESTIRE